MSRVRQATQPNWTPDVVRQRIEVGKCINYLHKCMEGELKLSPDRLKAIELLLSKALPNLNAIDLNLDGSATLNVVSDRPQTIEEWEESASRYLAASSGGAKPSS